jgi:signal transduction histidine kinase
VRKRTWPLLLIGFGVLLSTIFLTGASFYQRIGRILAQVEELQRASRESDRVLTQLQSELFAVAILVRDYLLESSRFQDQRERRELLEHRRLLGQNLDDVERLIVGPQRDRTKQLRQAVDEYLQAMDPVFDWTPIEKYARARDFLHNTVRPNRNDVLEIADEIGEIVSAELIRRQSEIQHTQQEIRRDLARGLVLVLITGIFIAGVVIARVAKLERQNEKHLAQLDQHRQDLRDLSQRLLHAHEGERKAISRELHDQVGQMLTALKFELANLREARQADSDFEHHFEQARQLTEQTLGAIRDLAMGLRPAILDELGLAPALEWQARDFSRRTGIPVSMQLDGQLENLPEAHRTCIFRVVQEALTNVARHAHASEVRVTLHGSNEALGVTIQDNGNGFDPALEERHSLGLLGIRERVAELDGRVSIISQPGKGTLVRAEIPVISGVMA